MLQVYNYMIESYLPKQTVRNYAHKRGELKKVYNNIVKLSKSAGYYKINLSKENQLFMFGIKETAIALKAKLEELSDPDCGIFKQKRIAVDNEKILSAELIGEDTNKLPETMTIKVNNLASPQSNRSKDLFHISKGLDCGNYHFTANINGKTYPLTFRQSDRTINEDTMKRMGEYLTRTLPGIKATMEAGDGREYSHLIIKADFPGKIGDRCFYFEDSDFTKVGVVDFFGLNHIEKSAVNSGFSLNGVDKQTNSNTFHIESMIQVNLHDSSDQPVTLRIVPDSKLILRQLDSVLNQYNDFIYYTNSRKMETNEYYNASKLVNELKGLEKTYQKELEACGLRLAADGTLTRDGVASEQAAISGEIERFFKRYSGFIAKLIDKSDCIAINPMEYLDKTIVTYTDKNRVTYVNPYVTSGYSGLFFNSYC